jgi:pyrroline-5-carboxylate reductase
MTFESIRVYEPSDETAAGLKKSFPEIEIVSTPQKAAGQEIVFLAVHPPVMMETLQSIKETVISGKLFFNADAVSLLGSYTATESNSIFLFFRA